MKRWYVFSLLLGVALAVFWPILFGGKIIVQRWALPDQYPRLAFISQALRSGESIIWTDNFLGGFPIYLGAWGEHVQPITLLLFKSFDFLTVTHWLIFFNFFIGSLLMYVLARELKLSKLASILAALVYVSNQWLVFYLGFLLFWSNAVPVIPLLFLSVLKIHAGKRWYLLPGVVALVLGWLAVMNDVMLYITLVALFFAVFLDGSRFGRHQSAPKLSSRFRTTLYCLLMIAIALILTAPRTLPILGFIEHSTRSGGVVQKTGFLESAESHGYIGTDSLVTLFFPYFNIPYSDYIPLLRGAGKLTLLYIGALPLFFVVIFFLGIRQVFKNNPLMKYFAVLFGFVVLILIKYVPLFYLLHKLPVLRFSGGTGKYAPIGLLGVAVLAGAGLDIVREVKDRKSFKLFLNYLKYFLIILIVILIGLNIALVAFRKPLLDYANNYFEMNLYRQATTGRPLAHYYQLIEQTFDEAARNFSFLNRDFTSPLVFWVVAFLVLLYYARGKLTDVKFRKLAVIVTILNFAVVWLGVHDVIPREAITDRPATVIFLGQKVKEEKPFRVFRIWGGLKNYVDMGLDPEDLEQKTRLETAMLAPNFSLLYDIPFLGGHENIMSWRQSRIMALVGSERAPGNVTWVFDQKTTIQEKLQRFQKPENRRLLSMMNVKYVLTSFEFQPPWKKVFESKVATSNIPVLIYENPEVMPRIYFAKDVEFIEPNEQSAYGELLQIKDFNRTTLIECLKPQCLNAFHQSDPSDEINILEMKSGYLKIQTRTKHPRWLVYSESNLPTWEAKLTQLPTANNQLLTDGSRKAVTSNQLPVTSYQLPIYAANYLFQAVYIPPGEQEVEFKYPGSLDQTFYAGQRLITKLLKL